MKGDDNISHSKGCLNGNFKKNPFWKILSGHNIQKRILNFQKSLNFFFFFLLSYSYCHLFPQCCYFQVSPLVQFNLVAQSWLTVTPWTAECWASLSICNSKSLLKLMFIPSVMPTIHPILCSPSSSCLQSLPASGFFLMSQLFTSGCWSIGVSASTSALPMNIQDWFPLGWAGLISLQSKGLSRIFSKTTYQKHQFFSAQPSKW